MQRRSFLSLMGGAIAAGPAAVQAAIAAKEPLTEALKQIPKPVWTEPWTTQRQMTEYGSWAVYRDHLVWLITDELDIEPGKPTNAFLFGPPVPPSLAVYSFGWAWREDTPLRDCMLLLGDNTEPSPARGMWLELKNNGYSLVNGPAQHFAGGWGVGASSPIPQNGIVPPSRNFPLHPPIVPKGDFSLQVETPALDLTAPVKLQFSLCGVIDISDFGRGGVPVPPA